MIKFPQVFAAALFFSSLFAPLPCLANIFLVTTSQDAVDSNPGDGVCHTPNGSCSLRAAVMEANALSGPDSISLPAGVYRLTIIGSGEDSAATGDLDLTADVRINGSGINATFIQADNGDRVFDVFGSVGNLIQLADLTIEEGDTNNASGAGIRNRASISLSNVRVRDCQVHGTANSSVGAGIANLGGSLLLSRSSIEDNTASGNGGGIFNSGTLFIGQSSLSDNTSQSFGGAVASTQRVSAINTVFYNNSAVFGGGALAGLETGSLTINNASISENSVTAGDGGGIFNDTNSSLSLSNSVVAKNHDAAAPVEPDISGEVLTARGNVIGSSAGASGSFSGNLIGSNASPLNPGLAVARRLSDQRIVVEPASGSILIDASITTNCELSDFFSRTRPLDGDGNSSAICDVGAVEVPAPGGGSGGGGSGSGGSNVVNGICQSSQEDCLFEPLEPSACVGANGFLGQINIASVINLQLMPLAVQVEYINQAGQLVQKVNASIETNQKKDFIINDLGLQPDTIGTVCIRTNAGGAGAWIGGIALYKPDTRNGAVPFGTAFDFALVYPFQNPLQGQLTLPLNTYHLGTNPQSLVANWVSVSDAVSGDSRGLRGVLEYFDAEGNSIHTDRVSLPDGGRGDYSGHEALSGIENRDAVGLVTFTPDNSSQDKYYLSVTRYFYDCASGICGDFLTAFNIPYRPATSRTLSAGVSTLNNEIAVVELNNVSLSSSKTNVSVFGTTGSSAGGVPMNIPALGTRHVIVNQSGATGFLANGSLGRADVEVTKGVVSSLSIFYKLDAGGELEYAYAAPFGGSEAFGQLSQFNSFIGQSNQLELQNSTDQPASVNIGVIDYLGRTVFTKNNLQVAARGIERLDLSVPEDLYGTVLLSSNTEGVFSRNYVIRPSGYVLTFPGQ